MKVLKRIPSSAFLFDESGHMALYGSPNYKYAYIIFKEVGKFVDGKFVLSPNEKVILRLTIREFDKLFSALQKINEMLFQNLLYII